MRYDNDLKEIYEHCIENIQGDIDKIKALMEELIRRIEESELSDDEWRELDKLATKVLLLLDDIV